MVPDAAEVSTWASWASPGLTGVLVGAVAAGAGFAAVTWAYASGHQPRASSDRCFYDIGTLADSAGAAALEVPATVAAATAVAAPMVASPTSGCRLPPMASTVTSSPAARADAGPLRDLRGYGPRPPDAAWPGGARLAVNFVINVEEGSEPAVLDGDPSSCAALCECSSDAPVGVRDLAAEGMFEYGSRCGIWRVLRTFGERGLPATAFVCALALERLPEIAAALRDADNIDYCCHGWRWEDHLDMAEGDERARISAAVASMERTLGRPPEGWYCRTAPSLNTRRLLVEHGGFVYDSDA